MHVKPTTQTRVSQRTRQHHKPMLWLSRHLPTLMHPPPHKPMITGEEHMLCPITPASPLSRHPLTLMII